MSISSTRQIMKRLTGKLTKAIALTMMVVMLTSVTMPMTVAWHDPTPTNRFVDVPDYPNWRNNPVSWAVRNGITRGTTPTTFSPNDDVTRAQFVTFFHRMYESPASPAVAFIDMPRNNDFRSAISWAYTKGITKGTTPTTFDPDRPISREELATMLHRHITGGEPAPDYILDRYVDQADISTWDGAREAVNWAAYHEIMGLGSTTLNPRDNATRAETVAMLYRVANNFNIIAPDMPGNNLVGTWSQRGRAFFILRVNGTGSDKSGEIDWREPRAGVLAICITPEMCRGNCSFPIQYNYAIDGTTLTLDPVSTGTRIILTSLPTQPIVIADSGYSIQAGAEGGYVVHYAVYINNPNTHIQAAWMTYRITAFDAAGGVLPPAIEHTISNINPERTNVYVGRLFTTFPTRPSRVEIELRQPGVEWGWRDSHEFVQFQPLIVESPRVEGRNVVGNIRNPNAHEIPRMNVVAVFRNANGDILGGVSTVVTNLPANGTVPFSIMTREQPYFDQDFTVYAYPG